MYVLAFKVEKILKGSLDSIPSPSVKIQIMDDKVCLRWKGKTLLGVVNKLLKTKRFFLRLSTMFCLISKLSRSQFEFSLKSKVMGSNPSYLLKYFLLYLGYISLCLLLYTTYSMSSCWSKFQLAQLQWHEIIQAEN